MSINRFPWLVLLLLIGSCKGVELNPPCAHLHRIAFDSLRVADTLPKKGANDSTSPPPVTEGARSTDMIASGRITVERVYILGAYDAAAVQMVNDSGRIDTYVNECWAAGIDEMTRAFLASYLTYQMRAEKFDKDDPRYRLECQIIEMTADAQRARMVLAVTLKSINGKRDSIVWSSVIDGVSELTTSAGNKPYMHVPSAYARALGHIAGKILDEIKIQDSKLRDANKKREGDQKAAGKKLDDARKAAYHARVNAEAARARADVARARAEVARTESEVARARAEAEAVRAQAEATRAATAAAKAEEDAEAARKKVPSP
jgi:hypothetical protein